MNTEQFEPEPIKKWTRKNYDLTLLHGKDYRQRAEIETTRDLSKCTEQLVCDFHDMAEKVMDPKSVTPADVNWHMIQAQKRMVSLMGRVAIEHKRSSDWLVRLTWVLGFLTVGIFIGTFLLIRISSHTDSQIEQIHSEAQKQWHQNAKTNSSTGQIDGVSR